MVAPGSKGQPYIYPFCGCSIIASEIYIMDNIAIGSEIIPIYQKHPNVDLYAICLRNKEDILKVKSTAYWCLTDLFLTMK
jgi:hypothetical protein